MQIFLDTTSIEKIDKYHSMGIIEGVTTNPSLVAKAGLNRDDLIRQILNFYPNLGSVSVEMLSETSGEMVSEAKTFINLMKKQGAKNMQAITIKVPANQEGLQACKLLSSEDIKVNVTLCFSLSQAIIAAKAGAAYISPFIGRLEDYGHDGIDLVEDIVIAYNNYSFETKVLAASIRNLGHVEHAAVAGAHVVTLPHTILEKMMDNTFTEIGQAKFLSDAKMVRNGKK